MILKEIFELTYEKNVPLIAKEHLTIGEKALREVLKSVGGVPNRGKKGWKYDDVSEADLNKSVYDFDEAKGKARRKEGSNINTKVGKSESVKEGKKEVSSEIIINSNNIQSIRKKASFDLDSELLKELRITSAITERHAYEIVETALRQYLKQIKE